MKTLSESKNTSHPAIVISHALIKKGAVKAGVINLAFTLLASNVAQASVETSLQDVQAKLVGTLLPLAAICGLVIAGFSFVMGHANARQHLMCAIVGAVIGFGAESIVSLIRTLIH